MSTSLHVELHHHGNFTPLPDCNYIGGKVEALGEIDTDYICFRDLDDFAKTYEYDPESLVYFKSNGHSFSDGTRLLYDDKSVREMVEVCMPHGKIELFVDHSLTEFVEDVGEMTNDELTNKNNDILSDSEDVSDPDYYNDSESEESDSEASNFEESDEELVQYKHMNKCFKEGMTSAMGGRNEESDYDSDDLRSIGSSSEDENRQVGYVGPAVVIEKKKVIGVTKSSKDDTIKWKAGMTFMNMEEFRSLVREYGIRERRGIKLVTNDANRCQVRCEDGCPFRIWCSRKKNSDIVEIKTLVNEHLCTKPYKNRLASVKYLAELYGERIRKNPQWRVKEMIDVIRSEMEVEVPRIKILRVRKAALEGVHDSLKEHYSRVRDFGHELLLSNPHNTVKISTTRLNEGDENRFKRIYVCYSALKQGWKAGCRPVLGLDGCFLKTVCGGQLLAAVGRDGNNQMFPVCYAVVESENTDSWRWFTELMRDDLDLGDGRGFTIISDQQKGLENAIKEYLPLVEHRFCTRHIYSNFRKKFPSQLLKRAFWMAATATHPVAHQRAMKQIAKLSKPAHDALKVLDPKLWSKAFVSTDPKADNIENNMSECFNSWIINERYMPLLTMLQEIHYKLMTRLREKRDAMLASDHQLCPRIKKRLDKVVTQSREWRASWDGSSRYLVKQSTRAVTVDLIKRSCDCRVFDLTGIPCAHVVAAIHDGRHQPLDYVSEYYKRDKYLAAYNYSLEAVKGEEYWEVHSTDIILPPELPKKLRGRPKRLRRREEWEGGTSKKPNNADGGAPRVERYNSGKKMHCSKCRQPGHRRTKCPFLGETTEVPPKATEVPCMRQKLTIKKPGGVVIKEPTTNVLPSQASQSNDISRGKGKAKQGCLESNESQTLMDKLRGPLGFSAISIPFPGTTYRYIPTAATPPAQEPPLRSSQATQGSTQRSSTSSQPSRRSQRLLANIKDQSKPTNTKEDPVHLDDD